MSKNSVKYLPHGLFVTIPIFVLSIIVLIFVFKINVWLSLLISGLEWLLTAYGQAEVHYLQAQIDELKNK